MVGLRIPYIGKNDQVREAVKKVADITGEV
jgi:hypothetical protein